MPLVLTGYKMLRMGHLSMLGEMDEDRSFLRQALEVARRARAGGNHPFGALLVDSGGKVLLETENTVETERDCT